MSLMGWGLCEVSLMGWGLCEVRLNDDWLMVTVTVSGLNLI